MQIGRYLPAIPRNLLLPFVGYKILTLVLYVTRVVWQIGTKQSMEPALWLLSAEDSDSSRPARDVVWFGA